MGRSLFCGRLYVREPMDNGIPLILFSGMGADATVFSEQMKAIPQLSVPAWIAPEPSESLASYAARWARIINPATPCFIGGASFGGFIALEMIPHLDVVGCFLIGSVRSPKDFPMRFRVLRKAPAIADWLPIEFAMLLSKAAIVSGESVTGPHLRALLRQMSESDAQFLRWACRAALTWEPSAVASSVPIHHIHGQGDAVLPVANTTPDRIVPDAGHALSMSHPDEVTRFLEEKMDDGESL